MMTQRSATVRDRATIVESMALIALAATMLSSVVYSRSLIHVLVLLWMVVFFPLRLLIHLARPKSAEEIAAATLAMVYLIWGAAFGFRPGRAPYEVDWVAIYGLHNIYWHIGCLIGQTPPPYPQISLDTMRWNWGLLATFYAAILVQGLSPGARKRVGLVGAPPLLAGPLHVSAWRRRILPTAELVLALLFAWNWLYSSPISGPIRWEWSCPFGLAGCLLLAVVHSRPWPPYWLSKHARRVARHVPAALTGYMIGLAWSLWGWQASTGIAAALSLAIGMLYVQAPAYWRHGHTLALAFLLAMFWGFAISAEIVKIPDSFAILQS
jgi:hypothetical protein